MYITFYESPVGPMTIHASDLGITAINIGETIESGESGSEVSNSHTDACLMQLKEYFSGTRKTFDLPLDFQSATNFYQEVWKTLQLIPFGKTRSYYTIAKRLGNVKAVRAVGVANAKNPIPIIVPCHRVIGKDGSLVGYAHGLKMKNQLLHLENPAHFNEQGVLFGNVA